jgi:hypothetical protein
MLAAADPAYYLISAPVAVVVAVTGIWFAGTPERRRQRQSREHLHNAVFGYTEGSTSVPGIVTILKGNGHGNVLELLEANREANERHEARLVRVEDRTARIGDEVRASTEKIERIGTTLDEHVVSDAAIQETTNKALGMLTESVGATNAIVTGILKYAGEHPDALTVQPSE